jgi:Na+:H+ antiporter, NhaC family
MREKPSFYVALTPIIFMMIVLVIGIGVMGWPASVCFLLFQECKHIFRLPG